MQLGLREYGLCPFPAYSGAEVLGVRMMLPGVLDEREFTGEEEFSGGPGDFDIAGAGGDPPGDGSEGGEVERSTGNRLYRLRTEELLRQHGIPISEGG
jgi:hypothetical protein